MAKYEIELKRSATQEIRKIRDHRSRRRILERIEQLAEDPRPPGSVKLTGSDYYRIRTGDYRIVYEIRDKVLVVIIVRVGHRREEYRW